MSRWTLVLMASAAFTGCVEDVDTGEASLEATPETCLAPKVLVCHVPPGNPARAHAICVGAPAARAHADHHGDSLGACEAACAPLGDACTADEDCCAGACDENGTCASRT